MADINLSDIEEIENIYIPLKDGCQLAARIFLPKTRATGSLPAVLEYLPYRKRDLMRSRDEPIHRYFASQGIASIRVDIRGSGDSYGIMHDEYSEQELRDALEVLTWIASQRWSNKKVGMMGISWGGFNSLQIAALNPPELAAIISLCASDDRYSDDAHYMGGCLLNENMQWGSILTMYSAYPPDPLVMGEGWKSEWEKRLNSLRAFPSVWMAHPKRDHYWKHGSICENYAAIKVPVYLIGGWADGYSNSVLKTFQNLSCPKKALIGPWAHNFPHDAIPGPSIGFLQEATRWWNHWMRGDESKIMDEPKIRIWMQDSIQPEPQYKERPGRWIAEEVWPSKNTQNLSFYLGSGTLNEKRCGGVRLSFSSPLTTGLRAGEWCAFGSDGEMPRDQRQDDGGSLVFDSKALKENLEILGSPEMVLSVSSDKPKAMIAIRLCEIAPNGSSFRVSYGILNLCHRDSHEYPEYLEPGEFYEVSIKLNDIAHVFKKKHRIRLSLSNVYWPIAWPSPKETLLTIDTEKSKLILPKRKENFLDKTLKPFESPAVAPGSTHKKILHLPLLRQITVNLATNEMVYTLKGDGGELSGAARARIEDIDLEIAYRMLKRYRIIEGDNTSAKTEFQQSAEFERGDWQVRIDCSTSLQCSEKHFQFSCDLKAYLNGLLFKERSWNEAVKREYL